MVVLTEYRHHQFCVGDEAGQAGSVLQVRPRWHMEVIISHCIHATDRQVRNTILHEIAHALVGPKHNYGGTWKAVARSIGCAGDRCHKVEFAPPRYIARCVTCGWAIKRNVRKRGAICKACRTPVSYITYMKKRWELATDTSDVLLQQSESRLPLANSK